MRDTNGAPEESAGPWPTTVDPRSWADTIRRQIAATGLRTDRPQAWLDRVRAGELSAAEATATLRLVYQVWVIALFLKALGSGWDVAWHFKWLRDDFAPPHDVNLVGDAIVIGLVLFHWYTRFGVDRRALLLMETGIIVFLLSAPVDVINHRINGLDITSWSFTHAGLYLGTAIMISGAILGWTRHGARLPNRTVVLGALWVFFFENVLFPNQHQEYGVLSLAAWDQGAPYAEPSLLRFAADQIGRPVDRIAIAQFALPIADWVYPLWITAVAMLVLVMARRSVGRRWTATTVAAVYVAWRCAMWLLLGLTTFPPSAVPFLLLAGAIAVDLVFLLALPDPARALLGGALVAGAVYAAGYTQTQLLVAPPIDYRPVPIAAALLALGWAITGWWRARVIAPHSPDQPAHV